PSGSSRSSSACTTRPHTRERVWGWQCARRSLNTTAAASGWTRRSPPVPGSASPCPRRPRIRMRMTDRRQGQAVDVLLVEDDPGDILMTKEAFGHYKIRNELHVVTDGEQALQFLHRMGDYADAPRPGLILLDLNLPRRDGLEVLAELKADPVLKVIPVVILTTSQAEQDILRSYALHANAYVSKPVDFERFMDVIRQIDNFFVTVVQLAR